MGAVVKVVFTVTLPFACSPSVASAAELAGVATAAGDATTGKPAAAMSTLLASDEV